MLNLSIIAFALLWRSSGYLVLVQPWLMTTLTLISLARRRKLLKRPKRGDCTPPFLLLDLIDSLIVSLNWVLNRIFLDEGGWRSSQGVWWRRQSDLEMVMEMSNLLMAIRSDFGLTHPSSFSSSFLQFSMEYVKIRTLVGKLNAALQFRRFERTIDWFFMHFDELIELFCADWLSECFDFSW